jgi:hypothetical protein
MTRALATLTLLALPVLSDDKPKAQTPAEKLAAIKKQHEEAEIAFRKEARALPDTPEGGKKVRDLFKSFDKGQAERFMAAYEIAKANPKSDVGFQALEWLLTTPRALSLPAGALAMKLATEHHASNPKIGKSIAWVGFFPPDLAQNADAAANAQVLFQAVVKKNPNRAARGQAVMALAWEAGRKFAVAEYKRTQDADKLAAEAEKAFEAVVKGYADCPRLMRDGQRTLGEVARQELYELQHLRVGKTAPEINAEDLDGVKFKLSDYRGKVVLLDFWGDW